jgi:putative spermidine/putrescine transport system permease protein
MLLLAPVLLFLGVWLAYPLLDVLLASVARLPTGRSGAALALASRAGLPRDDGAMAGLALAVTAMTLVLSYPLAYLFARVPRLGTGLVLLASFPWLLGALVRSGRGGAIASVRVAPTEMGALAHLAIATVSWFGPVLVLTFALLPCMLLALIAGPPASIHRLLTTAASLGADNGLAFRRVYLPLSRTGAAAGFTLVFALALAYQVLSRLAVPGPAWPGGLGLQLTPTWPSAEEAVAPLALAAAALVTLYLIRSAHPARAPRPASRKYP